MIKPRTILVLLFIAVLFGAVLWSVRRLSSENHSAVGGESLLFGNVLTDVNGLTLSRGGRDLELSRNDGKWRIIRPFETGADNQRVEAFLDTLSSVRHFEVITPAQRRKRDLNLEDFGLHSPTGSVVVVSQTMRGEVFVGSRTPLEDGVYAMFTGNDNIYVCSPILLDLLSEELPSLRQDRLFEGSSDTVSRIELFSKGKPFTRIVREGAGWRITEPVDWPANAAVVGRLLELLFSARIREFLWDPLDEGSESLASHALSYGVVGDDAEVRVQLWMRGGRGRGIEVRFGKIVEEEKALVAVVRSGMPGIIAMNASLMEELRIPVSALRDSRLWEVKKDDVTGIALLGREQHLRFELSDDGEWRMIEPVQVRADTRTITNLLQRIMGLRAVGYVDDDSGKIDLYGLDRPVCTLELKDAAKAYRLKVGSAAGVGALTYVMFDGKNNDVIRTQMAGLPEVALQNWDPRHYQDKVVLHIPSHRILSISLMVDGLSPQEVHRDENGIWKAVEPLPAVLDNSALKAILSLTGNLRAIRVEELAVRDPGAFGMDTPWATLTLGVEGENAINRVLLIGRSTAGGGRYAMVRGGDVLFVLSPEQVKTLECKLVRKPM